MKIYLMPRKSLLTVAIVAVIVFPTTTFTVEYIVGDDGGWRPSFDYANWANNKTFRVGDRLVFKYKAGIHNVYQATEEAYNSCIIPQDAPQSSGNDTIILNTPGPRYFFCGVGLHCEKGGQKLHIIVEGGDANATSQWEKLPIHSPESKDIPQSATPLSPRMLVSGGSTKKRHQNRALLVSSE